MLKKLTSILLAALTLTTIAAPALAAEKSFVEPTSAYVQTSGKVVSVGKDQITIERADGEGQLVLNVDENTAIVNNATKKAMSLSSIRKGTTLYAWHAEAMTRSLPPQAYAYAITANVKGAALATFFEVAAVEQQKDGSIQLLNEAQDLYVGLEKGMTIRLLGKSGSLKPSAVRPGDRLFVWLENILMSYPAFGSTDTAVLIESAYDGSITIEGEKVYVNGRSAGKAIERDGETYVEAATVGGRLGFSTRSSARKVTLTKGEDRYVFERGTFMTIEQDGIATETPIPVPFTKDGKLYVALETIETLGNYFVLDIVR